MSLIPTVYRSTDPGAPVLTGQAGSLIALLHAVLVTGYGSGANVKPGAGWTRPFSSSAVHVYRNSPVNGSGAYLRVRDDASADMLNTPALAQALAYSSMTDIDTGVDRTPSVARQAQGSLIAKAPAAGTAARRWMVVATDIGFYLFTQWFTYPNNPNAMGAYFFGDINTAVGGDAFPFAVFGADQLSSYNATWNNNVCSLFFASTVDAEVSGTGNRTTLGVPGGFIMRSYSDGLSAPGRIATCGVGHGASGTTNYSYGSGQYRKGPDPAHGGYNYIAAAVREASHALRGYLPGVLVPLHSRPYTEGAIVPFVEGIGLGQWLAVNYNVAEPDVADRNGQVLFRLDAPWK